MPGRWLTVLVVLVFCAGCGPAPVKRSTAKVSGTVKYKSAPVTKGTIVFHPPSGAPAFAQISPDGAYTLDAVIGENTVTVESRKDPPPSTGAAPVRGESLIPEKYSIPNTSKLTKEVKDQPMNTLDFDLTD